MYITGIIQSVNSTFNLGLVTVRIFNTLNSSNTSNVNAGISLPAWQSKTKGMYKSAP